MRFGFLPVLIPCDGKKVIKLKDLLSMPKLIRQMMYDCIFCIFCQVHLLRVTRMREQQEARMYRMFGWTKGVILLYLVEAFMSEMVVLSCGSTKTEGAI